MNHFDDAPLLITDRAHEIEIRVHLVDGIPGGPSGKFRAVKSRGGSIAR